jgi:hypothetical protein
MNSFKASRKKFHKKRFFSSGNLAIENLIGILKIQEILQNPEKSEKSTGIKKFPPLDFLIRHFFQFY